VSDVKGPASSGSSGGGAHPSQVNTHTFANTVLVGLGVAVFAAWHLAVATTVASVGLGDVSKTLQALVGLEPISGLPGGETEEARPTLLAFAAYALLLLVVLVGGAWGLIELRVRRRGGADTRGMATKRQVVAALGEDKVRASAEQTRPSMSPVIRKHAALGEIGLRLGREQGSGADVWLTLQDHLAVIASTGGGKSVSVMIPAALSAPGALIVTSNEVSILDLIVTERAKRGRVWVFDPLGRTSWPEQMVWNPVQGCEEGETALARGVAFAAGLKADGGSTNAGFFQRNAMIALSRMLHAAALDGRDMAEVLRWATNLDTDGKVAANLIRRSTDERAEKGWAAMLDAVSTGADETVASSRQTLQQAVEPLTLRKVTKWVTPTPGAVEFDARAFVTSTDTLVLISDDSSSTNVGPLCTMLLQEVMDSIKSVVPFLPHGRLDPPMRLVGDEFANIAPVEKAPELSSEVRKLGVQLVLAFQSEQQLRSRWGDRGQTLLEQMSAELILAGVKSTNSLKRYSDLAGKVEVEEHTTSYGEGGVRGGSTSTRERDVMRADQVRTLADGTGLLVWRNAAPMVIEMTPWFKQPQAEQLQRNAKEVAARRAVHATSGGRTLGESGSDSGESPALGAAEKAPS
jgi:type IV secretion system protein VirD4